MEQKISFILNNSISMSLVILAVFISMKTLFRNTAAKNRYYTWLIVVIGLLLPIRPSIPIHIAAIEAPLSEALQTTIAAPIQKIWPSSIPAALRPANIPDSPMAASSAEQISRPIAPTPKTFAADLITLTWKAMLLWLWCTGFLSSILFYTFKHIRFLKLIKRWSQDINKEILFALLESNNYNTDPIRKISIKASRLVHGPMLIGILKPVILLPQHAFEIKELGWILEHELIHYRRKDLLYWLLVLFTKSIHWFNPLVHLMARSIKAECEISCDALLLQDKSKQQRISYAETLISMMRARVQLSTELAMSFHGGKTMIGKRIVALMNTKKHRSSIIIFCFAMICTISTGIVPKAAAPQENKKETAELKTVTEEYSIRTLEENKVKQIRIHVPSEKIIVKQGQDPDKILFQYSQKKDVEYKTSYNEINSADGSEKEIEFELKRLSVLDGNDEECTMYLTLPSKFPFQITLETASENVTIEKTDENPFYVGLISREIYFGRVPDHDDPSVTEYRLKSKSVKEIETIIMSRDNKDVNRTDPLEDLTLEGAEYEYSIEQDPDSADTYYLEKAETVQ